MKFLLSHPYEIKWLAVLLQFAFPAVVALIGLIFWRVSYKRSWPWAALVWGVVFFAGFLVFVFWMTVSIGTLVGRLGE